MDKKTRREATPIPLMRAQIAAHSDGLVDDDLIEVTRRLFTPEAFEDWLDGYLVGRDGIAS